MKRLKLSDLEREDIERYRTEFWTTNNNGVFKRRYHEYLGQTGKLLCDYCAPGSGCNKTRKREWYHTVEKEEKFYLHGTLLVKWNSKYPSWKLVSKNEKQWMKKPLKFVPCRTGLEIKW